MIEVEWAADCPVSGIVEIDPADFAGMTQRDVIDAVYLECLKSVKANADCYVLKIDRAVKAIMEAAND